MSDKPLPSIWPNVYCELLPKIRDVARRHGYAIGVHGSMVNDCDLIAAPWVEDCSDPAAFADEVRAVLEAWQANGCPGRKAHGRLVWSFSLDPTHYIDLSVLPKSAGGGHA